LIVLNCDAQRWIIESNPRLVVIVVGSHGNQSVGAGERGELRGAFPWGSPSIPQGGGVLCSTVGSISLSGHKMAEHEWRHSDL
jgi:hypothetical protein